ncbi:hypothetical protein GWI33_004376 [Rhynchophorus ferrugineus]|uniref:Uncharacterized protein n=1 Tax=Rhynchophorus ferrugineus TaxID=354439 RepID=A0A834MJY4_RHYFE|nr:hypothetical protein GWI33_004376 [Rhynchophorus ferrugineus]
MSTARGELWDQSEIVARGQRKTPFDAFRSSSCRRTSENADASIFTFPPRGKINFNFAFREFNAECASENHVSITSSYFRRNLCGLRASAKM